MVRMVVRVSLPDGVGDLLAVLALPHPGVVVLPGTTAGDSHPHPLPGVLVDLDPAALDRLDVADEVPAEGEGELLDLAHPDLLGVREDGVLLGVGGQHAALVAGQVGGGEVTAQGGGDVEVADLVPRLVPVDADHPVLRLAVLVRAKDDAHGPLPLGPSQGAAERR